MLPRKHRANPRRNYTAPCLAERRASSTCPWFSSACLWQRLFGGHTTVQQRYAAPLCHVLICLFFSTSTASSSRSLSSLLAYAFSSSTTKASSKSRTQPSPTNLLQTNHQATTLLTKSSEEAG